MIWDAISGAIQAVSSNLVAIIKEFHLDPENALKLEQAAKQAMYDFQKQMWELEVKDKDSARNREIQLKDPTTHRLAYISLYGFFAVLAMQFYFAFNHIAIDTGVQRTLDISTGVLFAMVLAVKDYYFGTSHGSAKKDETLDRLVNHKDPS